MSRLDAHHFPHDVYKYYLTDRYLQPTLVRDNYALITSFSLSSQPAIQLDTPIPLTFWKNQEGPIIPGPSCHLLELLAQCQAGLPFHCGEDRQIDLTPQTVEYPIDPHDAYPLAWRKDMYQRWETRLAGTVFESTHTVYWPTDGLILISTHDPVSQQLLRLIAIPDRTRDRSVPIIWHAFHPNYVVFSVSIRCAFVLFRWDIQQNKYTRIITRTTPEVHLLSNDRGTVIYHDKTRGWVSQPDQSTLTLVLYLSSLNYLGLDNQNQVYYISSDALVTLDLQGQQIRQVTGIPFPAHSVSRLFTVNGLGEVVYVDDTYQHLCILNNEGQLHRRFNLPFRPTDVQLNSTGQIILSAGRKVWVYG